MEVVLFPRELDKHQAQLKLESLAFFRGQVEPPPRRAVAARLRRDPLQQADETLSTAVVLRITCNRPTTEATLKQVRELVKKIQRPKPLYLEL